jgi:molecular chaperone HscA
VSFAVDADGLLTVSAREETTGTETRVEVKPSYGLAEGEIERMLLASMEHAREDVTRRLLAEARVEAERVRIATEAALAADATLLEDGESEVIGEALSVLVEAVAGEDRDAIDAAVAALDAAAQPFAQRRMDTAFAAALSGQTVVSLGDG